MAVHYWSVVYLSSYTCHQKPNPSVRQSLRKLNSCKFTEAIPVCWLLVKNRWKTLDCHIILELDAASWPSAAPRHFFVLCRRWRTRTFALRRRWRTPVFARRAQRRQLYAGIPRGSNCPPAASSAFLASYFTTLVSLSGFFVLKFKRRLFIPSSNVSAWLLQQVFFVLKVVCFFFIPPMFLIFPRASSHSAGCFAVFWLAYLSDMSWNISWLSGLPRRCSVSCRKNCLLSR